MCVHSWRIQATAERAVANRKPDLEFPDLVINGCDCYIWSNSQDVKIITWLNKKKRVYGASPMKKSYLPGAVCAFVLAILAASSHAALVVPAGLSPGDTYHVIFASSTTRDATSSNIADYDAHIQAAADAAGIGSSIGLNDWRVVGSTPTVSAVDHLSSLFSSTTNIPIYNQNGDLVSASFDGLWDGALDNPVGFAETGTANDTYVFTGSDAAGAPYPTWELGGSYQNTRAGDSGASSSSWINAGYLLRTYSYSFYGLSEELTVPTTVPLPAAAWLFGAGLLGLIAVARRKVHV